MGLALNGLNLCVRVTLATLQRMSDPCGWRRLGAARISVIRGGCLPSCTKVPLASRAHQPLLLLLTFVPGERPRPQARSVGAAGAETTGWGWGGREKGHQTGQVVLPHTFRHRAVRLPGSCCLPELSVMAEMPSAVLSNWAPTGQGSRGALEMRLV